MIQNSMHFRRGQKFPNIVFLGACPGQYEWKANPQRPFARQSGSNLKTLLSLLCQMQNRLYYGFLPSDFSSLDPDDYTLMNSHSAALWKAKHQRTMPKRAEVEDTNNIQRLADELDSVQARVIIGFGRPVEDIKFKAKDRQSGPMLAI